MSHAFVAISSAAVTGYLLSPPPAGDGGWQFGMLVLAIAATVAACVAYSMEDKP